MFSVPPKVQKLTSKIEGLIYKNEKSSGPLKALIFHGYGANCHDLFPIASYLNCAKIDEWAFPDGLLAAPGVPGGRAWFPLDMAAIDQAMREGRFRDFSGPLPQELTDARVKVANIIKELGWKPETTLVGGFSQGAMLATDLFLNSESPFRGLIILSGTWLGKNEWLDLAAKRPGKVFQSHGVDDPILPYNRAEELHKLFEERKWSGPFIGFQGAHEIPPAVLKELAGFINHI